MHPDFHAGARRYLSRLSGERKTVLRQELSAFVASQAGRPRRAIERAWIKLGAQTSHTDLVMLLEDFVEMLSR